MYLFYLVVLSDLSVLAGDAQGVARGVSARSRTFREFPPELAGAGGLDHGEGGVFGIFQVINDFAVRGTKGRIARGLQDCKNEFLEDILDAESGHVALNETAEFTSEELGLHALVGEGECGEKLFCPLGTAWNIARNPPLVLQPLGAPGNFPECTAAAARWWGRLHQKIDRPPFPSLCTYDPSVLLHL
jgi:hypothetical protein